jgi:hypothetical protein
VESGLIDPRNPLKSIHSTMSDALPEMQYRFLGRTGLKVSVISLGSWLTYGGHVGNGNDKLILSMVIWALRRV